MTVFLAAFLLFQIELTISKLLLPKFGGSYLVWGGAVVFFQCLLLLGYGYSRFAVGKAGLSRPLHLALMLLPLLFFPGRPLAAMHPHAQIPLMLGIFWQLLSAIGPVFFVLSTVSIIFQAWLAFSRLPEGRNPYVLYSVSNLGSFLALLSYPFFFELYFDLNTQLAIWRAGYLLLLIFYLTAFNSLRANPGQSGIKPGKAGKEGRDAYPAREQAFWFFLAAAGSLAFLSVTDIVSYEIAPCPLLWVVPLCIYLLSFVLAFRANPFCPKWIKERFHLTIAASILFYFLIQRRGFPFLLAIAAYFILLFSICMFCQGRLAESRPASGRGLTKFYLIIAAGSFMGGVFASWIAPLLFTSMREFLCGLLLIPLALWIRSGGQRIDAEGFWLIIDGALLLFAWPLFFHRGGLFSWALVLAGLIYIYRRLRAKPVGLFVSILSILCLASFLESLWANKRIIYKQRNYYGIYQVVADQEAVFFVHGSVLQGAQYLAKDKEHDPLTYFHRQSLMGKLMESRNATFERIGIVGLGAGTLAAYGRPGQQIDFFELDRDVFKIAKLYFKYLDNSPARINYIFGDARISLGGIPDATYDLLVIDAFSGDSVPIHLLTKEAIAEYRRVITKKGIIIFNASNRYLFLDRVLTANARSLAARVCVGYNQDISGLLYASTWVALTWDEATGADLAALSAGLQSARGELGSKDIRPWTDSYSNLLAIIRPRAFFAPLFRFRPSLW